METDRDGTEVEVQRAHIEELQHSEPMVIIKTETTQDLIKD